MKKTSQALHLPTIHESPLMENPKTPSHTPAPRQDTPIPDSAPTTPEGYTAPPSAPRHPRTASLNKTSSPTSDEEALFSIERPDESPTLRPLRRRLCATHIDPRYLDRPIAKPAGPRPVPDAPQRLKRHRHSEPVMAVEVAGELMTTGGLMVERSQLTGPRPLAASASVRLQRLKDPFVTQVSRSVSGGSAWMGGVVKKDEEDGLGSDSSTPKASRSNKRRAVGRTGMLRTRWDEHRHG